jgi:hypothetical protein
MLAKTLEDLYNDKYDYVGEDNASIQYPYVFYDTSKVQCEVKDLHALLSIKPDKIESIDIKPFCFYTKKGVSGKKIESYIVIFDLREVDDQHATISHANLYERLYQKNEKNWVIVTYWNNQTKITLDKISNNHNKLVLTETAASDDNIDNSKKRRVISYTLNLKSPIDHIVVSNNTRIHNTEQSIKVIPYDKRAPKFLPNNPISDDDEHLIPIVARFIYG